MTQPSAREIFHAVVTSYAAVNPRDLRDTEIHTSQETLECLATETGSTVKLGDMVTILGLSVRIDDSLPFGVTNFVTENAEERAIRRLRKDGQAIHISMPKFIIPPTVDYIPHPTLRGLLRHWWEKLTQRN